MLILFCGFPSVHLSNYWIKQFSARFPIIYWSFPFSILRIDSIFSHFSRCFPSPLWRPFRPAPSVGASTAAGQVGLQLLRGQKWGVVLDLFKDQFLVRNGCLNVERFQDFFLKLWLYQSCWLLQSEFIGPAGWRTLRWPGKFANIVRVWL